MKTLILYATKYGAAREIALLIAENMGDADTFDLKQVDIPDIAGYDCVIIGSSLYATRIRKEARAFVSRNKKGLLEKKLGLFLSGMGPDSEKSRAFFDSNFPDEIVRSAKAKGILGGIFDPEKATGPDRFIMKIVAKQSVSANTIDKEKIEKFAALMRE